MVTQCPSCGRNMEGGQKVCACGRRAETPVTGNNVLVVVLIGALLIVVMLGAIAALGVIAWKQFGKYSEPAPPIVTQDTSPAADQSPRPPTILTPIAPMPVPTIQQSAVAPPPPQVTRPTIPPVSDTERLISQLRSPKREARQAAAEALQTRGWEPTTNEQSALVLVAMDNPLAAEKYGEAAVDALCLPLQDGGHYYLPQTSAECLGRILDTHAVGPLSKTLRESKDSEIRRAVATALGRIRDRDSIAVLRQALIDEPDEATKTRIAAALEKVTDQTEPNRLVAALKDDDSGAQLRAAVLLARAGDDHGLTWMEQTINGEDPQLREKTMQALREIGGPAVVKILVARVGGSGYDGPTEAVDALVAMGETSIAPMVAALPQMKSNGRWIMLIGLARLGPPAMHALTASLPDAPTELKKTVCQVLGGMGDREDVVQKPFEPLIALLSDPDARIRRSAAYSLELLNWEPASAEQRKQYERAKQSN